MIKVETDCHSHILPGIDDGSDHLEESLAMAKAAMKIGIKNIIATPHYEEGYCENGRSKILEEVKKLNEAIQKQGMELNIIPGCEIMLSPQIPELLKENMLMTLRDEGKEVLVELPMTVFPMWSMEVLYKIQLLGYSPILAHPERYVWVQEDEAIIQSFINKGVKLQSNLSSMVGKYGRRAKRIAESLHSNDLVYCWGSDAHSRRGYEVLEKR